MMSGIIKPRNWLKIPLKVRNALTAASLKKLPKTTPKMMAMMILAKSGVLIFAKSGILILFIFVALLFDCKGTLFLTKIQGFRCFLDDDKQKMPPCFTARGHKHQFFSYI